MTTALGLIEVRGYLGAVSVADAALKAANVQLKNAEVIRGGLTTIELEGDVAAVQAAVDASTVVAESLNCLISSHVIARLDEQTEMLLKDIKDDPRRAKDKPIVSASVPSVKVEKTTLVIQKEEPKQQEKKIDLKKLREELTSMKVVDLRKQAYRLNLKTLTKKEIKFANKKILVEAIISEVESGDIEWS